MMDDELHEVHFSHCNQGEYQGVCKYQDEDCPAMTDAGKMVPDYDWLGLWVALQKTAAATKYKDGAVQLSHAVIDRAAASHLRTAIERDFVPRGEVEKLREALDPFARAAAIQFPLSAHWPDDKPNDQFLPTAWPDWGDFKRAATALGGDHG